MNRLPPEYDLPTGMKDGDRIINTIKVENHLKELMSAALKTKTKTKKKRKVKNED